MSDKAHLSAIRRLIRADLASYSREAQSALADRAAEHYRRLIREDAARLRRAERLERRRAREQAA